MRVTSELWVSSIVRRAFSQGAFAAIARRGAAEAGAILIVRRGRAGEVALYAPAPQSAYGEARPEDRIFTEVQAGQGEEAVAGRIEREQRFDTDLWIVELEMDEAAFAGLVTVTKPSAPA